MKRAFKVMAAEFDGKYVPVWKLKWTKNGYQSENSYKTTSNLQEVYWDMVTDTIVFPIIVELKENHKYQVGTEVYYEPFMHHGKIKKSVITELIHKPSDYSTKKISGIEDHYKKYLTPEQLAQKEEVALFVHHDMKYRMANGDVVNEIYIKEFMS